MSYLRKFEYTIIPEESYQIIRNCSVCKGKAIFANSNKFRANANGNRLDVWLIYQCKKCKHTYNLTIYERVKADNLSPDQIVRFMENDTELAMKYGTDKSFFISNKAEIDLDNIKYQIINKETQRPTIEDPIAYKSGDRIQISDPSRLSIRTDKIIASILQVTRNKVKLFQKNGDIEIIRQSHSKNIDVIIHKDILPINS